MPLLEYHRPKTLEEALALLKRGVPLAGGTNLVPRRSQVEALVDLQELKLNSIRSEGGLLNIGATCTLQQVIDFGGPIPPSLAEACGLEAGLNLRNMATMGGLCASGEGRSPTLTVLVALSASAVLEPGHASTTLDDLLDQRPDVLKGRLITALTFRAPEKLAYEQVARAPADRPIVCAAAARTVGSTGRPVLSVALGGWGARPAHLSFDFGDSPSLAGQCCRAAQETFSRARDTWASAEYRSHVAGVLMGRVVKEVTA